MCVRERERERERGRIVCSTCSVVWCVGLLQKAAVKGIAQVSLSRITMAAPGMSECIDSGATV